MPYLDDKGYCKKCGRVTKHRFSLKVTCLNCKTVSTQADYRKAEEEKKASN